MNWVNSLDKIYVINLAKRTDRMQQAKEQLDKYNIPFERWEAVENNNGAEGLRETMECVFQDAINKHYKRILVFEDDLDIIEPGINEVMNEVVTMFPPNFDMIFLGCQLCQTPKEWFTQHLLKVQTAYATHAVIYSLKCIKQIMSSTNFFSPIDNCLVQMIQPKGETYCTHPLLISQIVSHSDIYSDREFMDWKPYLEIKYVEQMRTMKKSGNFHPGAKNYYNL